MMRHYDGLDGLKGIAILGVVMVHWGSYLQTSSDILQSIINTGAKGVEIFLIIAVFFACNSYSRWKSNKNFGGGIQWIRKHLIRLLPLFYLTCAVAILIGGTDQGRYYSLDNRISAGNIISHIFLLYGFNPYWINSILGVEWYLFTIVLIYIFIPLAINRIETFKQAIVLLMISIPLTVILNVLLKVLNPVENPSIWFNYIGGLSVIGHLPAIFSGFTLFHFAQNNPLCLEREKQIGQSVLLGSLTLLILLIFGDIKYSVLYWDVLCGFVVLSQLLWSNKIIKNPLFTALGQRSYEIYLVHILLIQLFKRLPQTMNNVLVDWLLKLILLVGMSWLMGCTYHRLESSVFNRITKWSIKNNELTEE